MTQKKVKNQHYVPQFYLNYFADIKKNIYVYDKATLKQFTSNSRGIGSQQYFYDLIQNDTQFIEKHHNQSYEKAFSDFLPNFLKLIDRQKFFKLKRYQKKEVATFITHQYIRTKKFREESYRLDTGVNVYEPVDHRLLEDLHPTIMHNFILTEYHLSRLLLNMLLNEYVWVIGRNITSQLLYTSDHPVSQIKSLQQLHDEQKNPKGHAFAVLSELLTFPLTPKYIIIFLKKNKFNHLNQKKNKILDLNYDDVNYFNSLQLMGCYRQVYSQSKDFSFAEKVERLLRQKHIDNGKDPTTILVPK